MVRAQQLTFFLVVWDAILAMSVCGCVQRQPQETTKNIEHRLTLRLLP